MEKFTKLAEFYSRFHRKLAVALNDLERRAADFYFLLPERGLKPRLIKPDGYQLKGFWKKEAKRLLRSRDPNGRPRFRNEQHGWAAANAAFYRMLENLEFRYNLWEKHRNKGLPDITCLAFQKIPLGDLKKLVAKGISTSVRYHLAGSDAIKAIPGIGMKKVEKLNQRIPKPRRRDIQPLLPIDL